MTREITENNKIYFQCEECGHIYETKEVAEECENWCREHKSCNLEIVKNAVNLPDEEKQSSSKNSFSIYHLILVLILGIGIGFILTKLPISSEKKETTPSNQISQSLLTEIQNEVLPPQGFPTKIVLGDVVPKMIACGVIDLEKLKKLYNNQIPEYWQKAINGNNEPIVINSEIAGYLLNIFWPLGLSNKTEFNKNIPFSEADLPYLASTGGWWLGKKDNGAEYFNKCEIIKLTPEQENLVYQVAQNTFRPCCNNSTFAQDCNHGSALLGALELAASQGYNEEELYRLAVELNSFWFPDNYLKTAIYFKIIEGKNWNEVDPKLITSRKYSSISGWIQNVDRKLASLNIRQFQSSGACGL